jgi:ribosomal protein L23
MLNGLIAPVMTEKSHAALEHGIHVFRVAPDVTKEQIKRTIEKAFSVKVAYAHLLTRVGKKRTFRRRLGTTSSSRRAYVRLKEGTINLEGGLSVALKSLNPVTSSTRGVVLVDRSTLWKGRPVKALTSGKRSTGGAMRMGTLPRAIVGGDAKFCIA